MQQRIIWFVLFLVSISLVFYWNIIRDADKMVMDELEYNDEKLTGDLNETTEVYARLDKRWRGSSKHLRTLQGKSDTLRLDLDQEIEDTKSRFDDAKSKLEYHKNKQDQINTDIDDKVDDNHRDLKKSIKFIKRDLKKLDERRVKSLETDILGVKQNSDKIDQIFKLEIIQDAIKNKKKN